MSVAQDLAYVRAEEEPILPAPHRSTGTLAWMRANLFSTPANAALTLVGLALLVWVIPPILRWAVFDAVWTGTNRDACLTSPEAACWPFVKARFGQFMYGRYPVDERWRIDLAAILLIIGLIPMAIPRVPYKRENALIPPGVCAGGRNNPAHGRQFRPFLGFFAAIVVLACLATGLASLSAADRAPMLGGVVRRERLSQRWSPSSQD
jgi:general L-amino acid transport system permease protein